MEVWHAWVYPVCVWGGAWGYDNPAKSLYLFNVAELDRGETQLCISISRNVQCSCLGMASLLLLGAVLGYDLEEFESPFTFFSRSRLILAVAEEESIPLRFNYFPSKSSWTHNGY